MHTRIAGYTWGQGTRNEAAERRQQELFVEDLLRKRPEIAIPKRVPGDWQGQSDGERAFSLLAQAWLWESPTKIGLNLVERLNGASLAKALYDLTGDLEYLNPAWAERFDKRAQAISNCT